MAAAVAAAAATAPYLQHNDAGAVEGSGRNSCAEANLLEPLGVLEVERYARLPLGIASAGRCMLGPHTMYPHVGIFVPAD